MGCGKVPFKSLRERFELRRRRAVRPQRGVGVEHRLGGHGGQLGRAHHVLGELGTTGGQCNGGLSPDRVGRRTNVIWIEPTLAERSERDVGLVEPGGRRHELGPPYSERVVARGIELHGPERTRSGTA